MNNKYKGIPIGDTAKIKTLRQGHTHPCLFRSTVLQQKPNILGGFNLHIFSNKSIQNHRTMKNQLLKTAPKGAAIVQAVCPVATGNLWALFI
jgi:hypothetical protein